MNAREALTKAAEIAHTYRDCVGDASKPIEDAILSLRDSLPEEWK